MSLRTTERGITLIKAFEGYSPAPKKCPAGIWTVGYGHTSKAGPPGVDANGPIFSSPAEAIAILRTDIDSFETQVERLVQGVELQDYQFDALVSFAFNAGVGNLAGSTLLKKLKAGDPAGAAAQFGRWNKFKNPVTGDEEDSDGLTRRRRAEAALFQGDLTDAATYMGMQFPPMPQAVVTPPLPKTMAQSKTGNSSVVGAVATCALGAKGMIDAAKPAVDTAVQVTQSAQTVTAGVQTAVQQTQQTVQTAQSVAHVVTSVAPHLHLASAAPWAFLTLVGVSAFSFVWYDRRKKLVEEGV